MGKTNVRLDAELSELFKAHIKWLRTCVLLAEKIYYET